MKKLFLLILITFILTNDSPAHHDPPGPPPIRVIVILDQVHFNEDQDDGIDGNAEFLLIHSVSQVPVHGNTNTSGSQEIDDLNFDDTSDWFFGSGELIYSHDECTPMATVSVNFVIAEIDSDGFLAYSGVLLSAAGVATAFGSPAIGAPVAVASLAVALLALNGNDDIGSVTAGYNGTGDFTLSTNGADGSADISFEIAAIEQAGDQCDPEPEPPMEPPCGFMPDQRDSLREHYDGFKEAYTQVSQLQPEAGNPGNLTTAELLEDRVTLQDWVITTVDSITVNAVSLISAFPEYVTASAIIDNARNMIDTDPIGAIGLYEEAALTSFDVLIDDCPEDIPTLSQWGLILLSLLLITFSTVVILRRQQSMVSGAGTNGKILADMNQPKASLFEPPLYWKTLPKVLLFVPVVLLAFYFAYGFITTADIFGTLISGAIITYLIHFILLSNSNSTE